MFALIEYIICHCHLCVFEVEACFVLVLLLFFLPWLFFFRYNFRVEKTVSQFYLDWTGVSQCRHNSAVQRLKIFLCAQVSICMVQLNDLHFTLKAQLDVGLLCTTILFFFKTLWLDKLTKSWKIYKCSLIQGIEIYISYFQNEHLNNQARNYWCVFYQMRNSTGTCSRFYISVQASCFRVLWQVWCQYLQYLFYLCLVVVKKKKKKKKVYVLSSKGEEPCYSPTKSHNSQKLLFC